MATGAGSYEPEEWSHEWGYSVAAPFGDPDSGGPSGVDVTILAGSPGQAERRALTYLTANFDDPVDAGVTAEALGGVAAAADSEEATYLVRITWPGGGR